VHSAGALPPDSRCTTDPRCSLGSRSHAHHLVPNSGLGSASDKTMTKEQTRLKEICLLVVRHRFRPGSDENVVVVGMHNRQSPDSFTERIRITEIIPNAKYGRPPRDSSNDIMLLKLERPLTFNDAVSPVCLPRQFKPIASGRRCYSTGWGALRCEFSDNRYHNHYISVCCLCRMYSFFTIAQPN